MIIGQTKIPQELILGDFNYAFAAFNFLAKLDFFLAAVFFTITPFVQAWSIFFVASTKRVSAEATSPASIAVSNFFTAVL